MAILKEWKPVIGYESLYHISNYGELRRNGKIQKYQISFGYKWYTLSKNNKTKRVSEHRMIAIHFIPNPDNKPQVNHIDGNKINNDISNLEWVTQSENFLHRYRVLGQKNKGSLGKFGEIHHSSKKILLKNLNGKIEEYEAAADFKRKTGLDATLFGWASSKKQLPYTFTKGNLKGYTLIYFGDKNAA